MSSIKHKLSTMAIMTAITIAVFLVAAIPAFAAKEFYSSVQRATFKPTSGWNSSHSTWYGPGFYGNHTASGKVMLANGKSKVRLWRKYPGRYVIFGAANPLPRFIKYGTMVEIRYNGVKLVIEVADTGPNTGEKLELMGGTVSALNYFGRKAVREGKIKNYTTFCGWKYISWRYVKKVRNGK